MNAEPQQDAKPRLKVAFARFWRGFDPQNNLFVRLLRASYDVQVGDSGDFVFYSGFSGALPPGRYVKIFYTGENVRPPWGECDWAFSFDYDDHPRHYRLPNYVFEYGAGDSLIKDPAHTARLKPGKSKFCNFIYGRPHHFRDAFFDQLSRCRTVDAPGRCRQNTAPIGAATDPHQSRYAPDWAASKVAWLAPYRFTVAFENSSHPGYTTEKIYQAMQAGSIPIYWGDPWVGRDFNPKSFINYHDHEEAVRARLPRWLMRSAVLERVVEALYIRPQTTKRVIRRVIEIAENEDLYDQVLREPWFHGNRPPPCFDMNRLTQRLQDIIHAAPGGG